MTQAIEAAVAALSSDPALAGSLGSGAAILVWDQTADHILWASQAASGLASGLADSHGRVDPALPARARLNALASGLAPRAGMRLERVRFEPSGLKAPSTLACRLLQVDGRDMLATVFLDRTPKLVPRQGPSFAPPAEALSDASPPPFIERVRRHGTRRFIWSMDRAGAFTSISQPLGEVVGVAADVIGRRWADIVPDLVLDEGGAVASYLEQRSTWSDHTVLWRLTDTSYVVPVDLGGMPVFGRGRDFEGFRGFGLCRAIDVQPAPDSPAHPARSALHEPASDHPPQPERAEVEESASEASLMTQDARAMFVGLQARLSGQLGATRSVPIRASDPDVAETGLGKPILSMAERGAFREIARTLGAGQGREDAPGLGTRVSADVVPLPLARPRDADLLGVLDGVPTGIVVLRGGTPVFANRYLLDLLGYSELAELDSRGGVSRLFTGRLAERSGGDARPLSVTARTGQNVSVEVRLTTVEWADGPASLLLMRPLPEGDGTPVARSLELDLARRDMLLEEAAAALDLSGLGAVTIDERGRVVALSRAAERLFGYAQNEVAGESFTILLAPESHRHAIDLVDAARAVGSVNEGSAEEREVLGRVGTGGTIPMLAKARRSETALRKTVLLLFRDVREVKRGEAELNATRRAAEAAVARQSEFLARVSHEIRTPLNAIIGFAEVMLEERFGEIGNDRYKLYLRDIHASGRHVVSLISDLLDLAKVTSGKGELSFTAVDLNSVLRQTVALLQPSAAQERVVLRAGLAKEMPSVVADNRSLKQIALNLVSNAVRFSAAGGQVIVSSGLSDGGDAYLRVRDTGIGMSPQDVEAAMEPFRQVSAVRRADGTGLGLPLSKALVEANHGVFKISSQLGHGTTVEVLFPPSRVLSS